MKYFLVVGEASGDLHASGLMAALRRLDDDPTFAYMGGPLMRAQGGTCVVRSEDMAFMGFVDVLRHHRIIRRNARKVRSFLRSYRPDVVICVDYAGFCFRYILPLARQEELVSALMVYYIPPKVWAWKKHRIQKLRTHTHQILTIFPFEVPFFEREDCPHAHYVGNPSLEQIEAYERTAPAPPPTDKPYIAILCGSRVSEVRKNLPRMLEACRAFPEYEVVIAGAPGLEQSLYEPIIAPEGTRVRLIFGRTYDIVRHARAALVTSGTATLETALLGTPQVVCYSVAGGSLANFVFRHFFHVPYISLVNLIAERTVVSELFGGLFTALRIESALRPLLTDSSERIAMLEAYHDVRQRLSTPTPAASTAAETILSALTGDRTSPEYAQA